MLESVAELVEAKDIRPTSLGFFSIDIPSMRVTLTQKVADSWDIELDGFSETIEDSIQRVYVEDRQKVRDAFSATVYQQAEYWVEYRVLRPDFTFMWIEVRGELAKDTEGAPYRLMGTIHDISARKHAEMVVEASENHFRMLADFMPQIVWTLDEQGNVDYYNKKWLEYTDTLSENAIQRGWAGIIHPDDEMQMAEVWKKSFATGTPFEIEIRLKRARDQSYRWHLSRCIPMRSSDGTRVIKWLGTNTDIHDQTTLLDALKAATLKAENAAAAKGQFLSNMSHEIRTPLTAILGFSQLLSKKDLSDNERSKYQQIVARNGKVLTSLIDDILDISKVEAGRLDLERIDFRLDQLLSDILEVFKETSKEKNIRFEVNWSSDTPLRVNSDPTRLRQILTNLIGNATKFTAEGIIAIDLNATLLTPEAFNLIITVRDSGIGLSDEQADHLFEPFSQADSSTTRRFGGSGLGLALSRRLAQALGGNVQVRDHKLGVGCTFEVSTIAYRTETEQPELIDNKQKDVVLIDDLPFAESLKHGLLVEDAPENRLLVSEILNSRGFVIDVAENGQEAVAKTKQINYDFILMDMQMPVMDGYEATRYIREQGYTKPIIALTALAMAHEKFKVLASGCTEHFTKPIDFERLLTTLIHLT